MEKEVDGWIEQLKQCKQLEENSIKILCEKVRENMFCLRANQLPQIRL